MASDHINYNINEEITRFTFEVHIKERAINWEIWFTNPTAGPWKKILYMHDDKTVELGRYEREEKRPDLILFHKKLEVGILIEAKDKASKILEDTQLSKTNILFKKEQKKFLDSAFLNEHHKNGILFVNSFLWFGSDKDSVNDVKDSFFKICDDPIPLLCIVVQKHDSNLLCFGELFPSLKEVIPERIVKAIHDLKLNKLS